MSVLPPLRIKVRLFAMQRETAGTRELRLEMPLGATVEDAWAAVVEVVPALASGRSSLRFAVNGDYSALDRQLADGDEIACIPPVSGGSGDGGSGGLGDAEADADAGPDAVRRQTRRQTRRAAPDPRDPRGTLRCRPGRGARGPPGHGRGRRRGGVPGPDPCDAGHPRAGPGGRGRSATPGATCKALSYEAFEPMALAVLEEIADEIEARFGVRRLAIVHRTGEVPLGDTSVVVVAVAPHRDAAFAAARHAIDETKARAPIWKAERFADGHVWIGHVARTGPAGEDG